MLSGWGVRPGDTQYTVTLQQELMPRLSADFSFTHRSWHGFFVTDDLNRRAGGVASHYESYTLTAPSDQRLAGGGGYPVTVFVPLTNAAPSTILMREEDIGEARSSVWDGFELALNSRLRNGLVAQVGTTTGRGKVNDCAVATLYNNVAGATAHWSQPARLQQRRAVADDAPRPGHLHRSEDRRPGQHRAAFDSRRRPSRRTGRSRTP